MRDKPTPKKLLTGIIILLVVLTGATSLVLSKQLKSEESKTKTSATQPDQKPAEKAKADSARLVSYDGQEGKTALELLKQNAEVVTKDSSYGIYVDSINGARGGTDGKYWAFYVNGQMAQIGADAYKTKAADKVEWKFE